MKIESRETEYLNHIRLQADRAFSEYMDKPESISKLEEKREAVVSILPELFRIIDELSQ